MVIQVRAMVDLLPEIEVVPGDPFNSSPTDTNLMGPGALQIYRTGEKLPTGQAKTPLVSTSFLCWHHTSFSWTRLTSG
jgi:magnesium chelatase subunit I